MTKDESMTHLRRVYTEGLDKDEIEKVESVLGDLYNYLSSNELKGFAEHVYDERGIAFDFEEEEEEDDEEDDDVSLEDMDEDDVFHMLTPVDDEDDEKLTDLFDDDEDHVNYRGNGI